MQTAGDNGMKLHPRELLLATVTGFVVLCGITFFIARPRLAEWKELRKSREEVRMALELDKKLLSKKDHWSKQFVDLKKWLPEFSPEAKVDTYWMKAMDDVASKYGLVLSSRQAGEEKKIGDIMELPIECREWEGSLDSLTHFLFDLQTQGAMLDIRQLLIKPKDKTRMRGRFMLQCAYARKSAK
jgi:hypothetical protein